MGDRLLWMPAALYIDGRLIDGLSNSMVRLIHSA